MQVRKRQIIAQINKMVNQFNENNKLIKDANKVAKNEKEMSELIMRNREIQDDCEMIDKRIRYGKEFAKDISIRLDQITGETIEDLRVKYNRKNATIDDCDEAFEKAHKENSKQEKIIDAEL